MTQRVGYMLAAGAYQALGAAVPVAGDHLAVSREQVSLTRLKISDQEHGWCQNVVRELAGGHAPGQVDGLPDEYWAVTRIAMYEKQFEDDGPEVMVMRMGDAAVVGLPGGFSANTVLKSSAALRRGTLSSWNWPTMPSATSRRAKPSLRAGMNRRPARRSTPKMRARASPPPPCASSKRYSRGKDLS